MKKPKKYVLYTIIGILCFCCYIISYYKYHSFSLETFNSTTIENSSIKENLEYLFTSQEFVWLLCFCLPIIIFMVGKVIIRLIKAIIKRREKRVFDSSIKIQKIAELNNIFKNINEVHRTIFEREYSRKSLDRVTGDGIIKYHIENDTDLLRTDIENAIYNLEALDDYNKKAEEIVKSDDNNITNNFKRIEKRILKRIIHKKEDFLITVELDIFYRSNGGRVYDSRTGNRSFDELKKLYLEWKNGKKYAETQKQERKIMNDDIRYNVLKRDNFTCQICGATAKEGAKLHVDHIIPISEGGKTVMSNLQTLCDRCNMGKSNKIEEDFIEDMICPKCGGKLVKRKGKYGEFIGCSNYPKCHYKK